MVYDDTRRNTRVCLDRDVQRIREVSVISDSCSSGRSAGISAVISLMVKENIGAKACLTWRQVYAYWLPALQRMPSAGDNSFGSPQLTLESCIKGCGSMTMDLLK